MKCLPIIALLVFIQLAACSLTSEPDHTAEAVEVLFLHQEWVHSFEEQQEGGDVQIFRPRTYQAFPTSWFRMTYVFHHNGDCEWLYLAPDDGHFLRPGSWNLDGDTQVIRIQEGDRTWTYQVVELRRDLLRMFPLRDRHR